MIGNKIIELLDEGNNTILTFGILVQVIIFVHHMIMVRDHSSKQLSSSSSSSSSSLAPSLTDDNSSCMSSSSISIETQVLYSKKMTIVVSAAAVQSTIKQDAIELIMQDFLTNYAPLLLVDDESEEEVSLDDARHEMQFIRQFATDSLATVV